MDLRAVGGAYVTAVRRAVTFLIVHCQPMGRSPPWMGSKVQQRRERDRKRRATETPERKGGGWQ